MGEPHMHDDDAAGWGPLGKWPAKSRVPVLVLDGLLATPIHRPVTGDEALYAIAAWAFHHAGSTWDSDNPLGERDRAGLVLALAQAWPRPRGRPKIAIHQALPWLTLRRSGRSFKEIAAKYGLSEVYVRDVVRGYRNALQSAPRMRVVAEPTEAQSAEPGRPPLQLEVSRPVEKSPPFAG